MHVRSFSLSLLTFLSFSPVLVSRSSEFSHRPGDGFYIGRPEETRADEIQKQYDIAKAMGLLEKKVGAKIDKDGNVVEVTVKDEFQALQLVEVKNTFRPKDWEDAVLYGLIGPDMYKMLRDFNLSGIKGGALTTAVAVKGASVAGKAIFEDVLGKKIGTLVGTGLDTLFSSFSRLYNYGYKTITRRKGEPFTHEEIMISKLTVKEVVEFLKETGKNASRLSSRAMIDRETDEVEVVDPAWAPFRKLLELKLRNQIMLLNEGLSYYAKDKNSRIALYALQIRDTLQVLTEELVLKTKSHKDLGEAGSQAAIVMFQKPLQNDYENLLKLLPTTQNESATVSDRSNKKDFSSPLSRGMGFDN